MHSCIIPRFDPMAGQEAWPDLDLAFAKIIRHEPRPSGTTRDGRAHYNSKISWDLAPFIGAICVVPNTGTKSNPIRTVIAFMKFQKGRPISGDLWGYRLERKCFSKPVRCGATKLNIATQVYMEYMYTIRVLPKIVLVAKAQGNSSESLDIEPSHDQRIYPNIRL